jgi:hypothetical protein
MTSDFYAQGQCLCGAVRFVARAKPVRMAQCHCRDCQRVSGAGHTSNALFEVADVEITGKTSSFEVKADSGNALTRHFCPTCGSRVFATNTGRPDMIVIPAGTFDDSSWFRPQAVLYTRTRRGWDTADDTVPEFMAMSPAPPLPR